MPFLINTGIYIWWRKRYLKLTHTIYLFICLAKCTGMYITVWYKTRLLGNNVETGCGILILKELLLVINKKQKLKESSHT